MSNTPASLLVPQCFAHRVSHQICGKSEKLRVSLTLWMMDGSKNEFTKAGDGLTYFYINLPCVRYLSPARDELLGSSHDPQLWKVIWKIICLPQASPLHFCRSPSFRSNICHCEEDWVGVSAWPGSWICMPLGSRSGLPSRIRPSVLRMRIIGGKRTLENNLRFLHSCWSIGNWHWPVNWRGKGILPEILGILQTDGDTVIWWSLIGQGWNISWGMSSDHLSSSFDGGFWTLSKLETALY